jgi:hypothetical protein
MDRRRTAVADSDTPAPASSVETVRIYARELRCGVFELEQATSSGVDEWAYDVPRPFWEAILQADEELKAATEQQQRATLAVVQHVVDHNPEAAEAFTEWARLGMAAFR